MAYFLYKKVVPKAEDAMRITERGQVIIPKPIRERYGLYPGTEVQFVERGHCLIIEKGQVQDPWRRYRGFLKLLKRADEVVRNLQQSSP